MERCAAIRPTKYIEFVAALWLFCLPAGPTLADAQRPIALFLYFPDQKETSSAVERAIQSQLSDLDVTLRKKMLPVSSGALKGDVEMAIEIVQENQGLAGFWYQVASEDQLHLYVVENRGDRILIRMIEEAEEGGRTEALAVIIRMSIAELLRGGTIGIEVPEPDRGYETANSGRKAGVVPDVKSGESGEVFTKRAPRDPHYLFAHALSYAYYVHSIQSPVNHGLDILFGLRPLPQLTVFVEYTFLSPLKVEDETVVLLYDRHPIRVGAGLSNRLLPKLEVGVSLSLLIDYVTYEVVSTQQITKDRSHVLVGACPRLEIGFRLTDHLSLTLSLGAEMLINPEYYGHRQRDSRRVVLDGFRVQPWVLGGIQFSHLERK